jgi:Phage terminase, small subunit
MADLNLESPRKEPSFRRYWDNFIGDIKDRPNLKPSHLWQLQVLCDLCVEYDDLREIISITGRTVSNGGGRNGDVLRITPEVSQLNKILIEIRNYSRMLGLILVEDTKTKGEEEENEFA